MCPEPLCQRFCFMSCFTLLAGSACWSSMCWNVMGAFSRNVMGAHTHFHAQIECIARMHAIALHTPSVSGTPCNMTRIWATRLQSTHADRLYPSASTCLPPRAAMNSAVVSTFFRCSTEDDIANIHLRLVLCVPHITVIIN